MMQDAQRTSSSPTFLPIIPAAVKIQHMSTERIRDDPAPENQRNRVSMHSEAILPPRLPRMGALTAMHRVMRIPA